MLFSHGPNKVFLVPDSLTAKQARKSCQRPAFLLVSKARAPTNKFYILRQITYIVYLHVLV